MTFTAHSTVTRQTPHDERAEPLADIHGIAILDLGGQYCHMIGRRLRDLGIRGDILQHDASVSILKRYSGIILSGGPQSVYDRDAPRVDRRLIELGLPVLGICYGHQLLAQLLGCDVQPGSQEYGKATLTVHEPGQLFDGINKPQTVWMSHADSVQSLISGMKPLANTDSCSVAAFADEQRKFYGVQFHPEVAHTECGTDILQNFVRNICAIQERDEISDRVTRLLDEIRDQIGERSVLFFVSGGVDSTVAFSLCARALPRDRVLGIYVDTGLMRKNETAELRTILARAGLADRLKVLNRSRLFLDALKGITDPETKRKTIGRLFIEVQADAMHRYCPDRGRWILGQGTIYPDTVESGGHGGTTAVIKTHHNRCDEVKELIEQGKVIEPLAEFYKDEVRQVGTQLGLHSELVERWPFPGPGLAIRVLCNDNKREPVRYFALPAAFSDYKAAHIPLPTVGVQGDHRTYRHVLAVKGPIDYQRLSKLSTAMCNGGKDFNRVIVHVAGEVTSLLLGHIEKRVLNSRRFALLREADAIVKEIMHDEDRAGEVWQFPTVLIPVSFTKGETIVLRPVNSEDGMTANYAHLPIATLSRIGEAISRLKGVAAVFLDVTDKPPATIEWE